MTSMVIDIRRIPSDVREVMDRIARSGYDVWLVGGAVRDLISGGSPKDWDLATSAQPDAVTGLFPVVVPVGIRHGTVLIHTGTHGIETTSYDPDKGITADLARRDFTMNAMAVSYPEGRLLDPHGGAEDLRAKLLRAVGDARSRFSEDPLRTLRAGRFVAVFGFEIDPDTRDAIRMEARGLSGVAVERIREELFKTLMGDEVLRAFELMHTAGVLKEILPELVKPGDLTRARAAHHAPKRLSVRLGALLLGAMPPRNVEADADRREVFGLPRTHVSVPRGILERLLVPAKLTEEVLFLLHHPVPSETDRWSDADVRRFIAWVGADRLNDVLDLAHAERSAPLSASREGEALNRLDRRIREQLTGNHPFSLRDLPVGGRDVMEVLGCGPGPAIGRILEELRQAALDDPTLNDRKILMDFLREKVHKKD